MHTNFGPVHNKRLNDDTRTDSAIKKSWKIFRGINPSLVGGTFYSKLFADTPSLRRMFPKNMTDQYLKLVDMLSTVVARLDNMEDLTEDIAAMARRHAGYGVKQAHYKLVGDALMWTLGQGLGKDWTPELKDAWQTCYNRLSATMISVT